MTTIDADAGSRPQLQQPDALVAVVKQQQQQQQQQQQYPNCANCGGHGHVYRICNHPVSSFGIICYRRTQEQQLEYVMVQRKDSLAFVEFIRGKYNLQNRQYLLRLLSNMTRGERESLLFKDFDALWHGFWQSDHNRGFMKEYEQSKTRFDMLRRGYYLRPPATAAVDAQLQKDDQKEEDGKEPADTLTLFSLEVAVASTSSEHEDTEFGFPKGRRNINESDLQCALREFAEESGISASDLRLDRAGGCQHTLQFEEVFTGSNNVRYRHVYFLAQLRPESRANAHVGVRPVVDAIQLREVKAVGWFDADCVLSKIRPHNVERRDLFKRVHARVSGGGSGSGSGSSSSRLNPAAAPFFFRVGPQERARGEA